MSVQHIKDLKKGDLELLTQLLSLQPPVNDGWLRDQSNLIDSFPTSLRRPETLLPRLALALTSTEKAVLCETHKPLNPLLIRRIFLQVSAESSTRVKRLHEYHPALPENVSQFLKRIERLQSLHMAPDLYRQGFQVSPDEPRFETVEGGCEACILAVIGGNRQSISDLRTSMIGRKKKRGSAPRLLPLVENWIEWTGQGNEIMHETDVLARKVRGIRRQLQQARRQVRRNVADGIVQNQDSEPLLDDRPQNPTLDGTLKSDDEQDPEGSIIDFYANIMSTTSMDGRAEQAEGIHPAFRDSIAFDPASGTFHRKQKPGTAYSESVYSRPPRNGPHSPERDTRGYSEDHARAYEDLVRPRARDGTRQADKKKDENRMTRISDFF